MIYYKIPRAFVSENTPSVNFTFTDADQKKEGGMQGFIMIPQSEVDKYPNSYDWSSLETVEI